MRPVAGFLVAALAALPLLAAPIWPIVAVGGVAAMLGGIAVVRLSTRLLTTAAAVVLVQYALALWVASGPPDFLPAIAIGVVLPLLLDVVGFAARFRGVAVSPRVVREQSRYWVGWAAGTALVGAGVAVVAGPLPGWLAPAGVGVGALAAAVGTFRLLTSVKRRRLDVDLPASELNRRLQP